MAAGVLLTNLLVVMVFQVQTAAQNSVATALTERL
jgi:hypothetical protein